MTEHLDVHAETQPQLNGRECSPRAVRATETSTEALDLEQEDKVLLITHVCAEQTHDNYLILVPSESTRFSLVVYWCPERGDGMCLRTDRALGDLFHGCRPGRTWQRCSVLNTDSPSA